MKKLFTFVILSILTSAHARKPFDFSKNHLKKFVGNADGKRSLDLSHKKIKNLPSDLSVQLKPVVDRKKDPIQVIDLSNNSISKTLKTGTFKGLVQPTFIVLSNNNITGVEPGAFKDLNSLQWIYLSHNRISGLKPGTFDDITGLWGLVLSHNNIKTFGPSVLESLRLLYEVDLSHNKIKTLEASMFAASDAARQVTEKLGKQKLKVTEYSNLQVLRFEGNPIKKVDETAFAALPYLQKVYVSSDLSSDVLRQFQNAVNYVRNSLQNHTSAQNKCQLVKVKSKK